MRKLKIIGCGNALPERKIQFGSQTRYRLSEDKTLLDLSEQAAKNALNNAGLKMNDIDCIIAGMATPLQAIPCNAALIHERIAKGFCIPAMDINTSCTSFISALDISSYLTDTQRYKNILIISGDTASAALNPNQRESYELFSDAASAFIVSSCDDLSGVILASQKTWSEGAHDTEIRGGCALMSAFHFTNENKNDYYFDMKGKKVLMLSARKLPGFLNEFLTEAGVNREEIDVVVPHQASRALDMIMPKLGFSKEKYIDNVSDFGNMISASIPFTLCNAILCNKIKRGNTVMLMGTAAGLTANLLLFKY